MSPVWVKLGDFGVSKRVQAQATTTFHTQVSTPVYSYSAPEVLGLDSNSETSDYTNSVDIWSLGCVIYELLVGTKSFLSESQVSRYYFGIWPQCSQAASPDHSPDHGSAVRPVRPWF